MEFLKLFSQTDTIFGKKMKKQVVAEEEAARLEVLAAEEEAARLKALAAEEEAAKLVALAAEEEAAKLVALAAEEDAQSLSGKIVIEYMEFYKIEFVFICSGFHLHGSIHRDTKVRSSRNSKAEGKPSHCQEHYSFSACGLWRVMQAYSYA